MELTYSKTTPTRYSDPEVQAVMKCTTNMFEALRIGRFLVDTLPLLKYIPFGGVAKLRRYHQEELSLFKSQLYSTKARLVRTLPVIIPIAVEMIIRPKMLHNQVLRRICLSTNRISIFRTQS